MRFWRRNDKTAALRAGESVRSLAALTVRPVFQIPMNGDDPPTEFRLFSVGVNETEKGPFMWDEIAEATCMQFWANKRVDLSMDWEHQALAEPPVEAPASAWWTPELRDGELWATNVKWTPRAEQQLRNKEYRYFSPAFTFDEESRRPERIINAALTNIPAMDGIAPLVAANAVAPTAKETKDMEELNALKARLASMETEMSTLRTSLAAKTEECAALTVRLSAMGDDDKETCRVAGLKFDAPKAERLSAVAALAATSARLREVTGQTTDAGALATLTVWKADSAAVAQLRADATALEERTVASELKSLLETGEAEGRIPPGADHPIRKSVMEAFLGMGGGKASSAGIVWLKAHIPTMAKVVEGTATSAAGGGASPDSKQSTTLSHHAMLAGVKPESIAKAVERLRTTVPMDRR